MNYLIGAGGHGRVILNICELTNLSIDAFIDNKVAGSDVRGLNCLDPEEAVLSPEDRVLVSIGDNVARKLIASALPCGFFTAIHPSAIIDTSSKIGWGTVVMASAVINADALIGNHVIINTSSVVEHDCVISDFVHISPNCTLCGNVHVGEGTHMGAGSVAIPGVRIGKGCVIGAGSVVIDDIPDHSLYVGNPAHLVRKLKAF